MKKKFVLLCSIGLALQVVAFCQQSSLTLTAATRVPTFLGKQWETKDGPLTFRVPTGIHGLPANAGKQARQAEMVDFHITNTSNAQIYVFLTDHATGDVVFFEVYDPHIYTPIYMVTREAGYYDIEIGDYGPNTWKTADAGCESTKMGLVLTWTNAYLTDGCNGFYIY